MTVHDARQTRFGGFYEDYAAADVYRHWPGKTITEAENHLFCLLTMAVSPIHTDHHYVQETDGIFERPVVVGTYVFSLLLGMTVPDISGRAIANLGVSDLRHTAPVYPGDTLYAQTTIRDTRLSKSRPNAGIVVSETVGRNQHDQVVTTFTRAVLLPRRNHD